MEIPKFAIIGDLMIDEYWKCSCTRLSPEAPIPVASLQWITKNLGGAGNVARNLRALLPNAEITACGFIGSEYTKLFECERIDLWSSGKRDKTNVKLRIVDDNKHYHLVRVDNEDYIKIKDEHLYSKQVLNHLYSYKPDVIILSDYIKGTITEDLAKAVINYKHLTYQDVTIIVDTRKSNISMFTGADWITPNRHEFAKIQENQLAAHRPATPEGICKDFDLGGMLLTRGSEGMDLHLGDAYFHEDSVCRNVIDVTGAGDTALAAFAAAIVDEDERMNHYALILKITNMIAGEVCEYAGTAIPARKLSEYIDEIA